ncbi:MAG: hypothetical protein H6717_07435 [Polyangiaceae bacterium]|nr:hypothetical protein [Polyangiaceae bacterium]
MDFRDRSLHWTVAAAALLFAAGCNPQIGDSCSVSTDCSNVGDRLCDTTQPGGYCTIFNCEPGSCPDEAICIAFSSSVSLACEDPQGGGRLRRTFCMRSCEGDSDCRGGYRCIDMGKDNPWGAGVVEGSVGNSKVCIVPYSGAPMAEDPNTEVCTGTDAGFDAWTPWQPDSGSTTTDAGTDAAADAAGDATADADADAGTDAAPSDAAAE